MTNANKNNYVIYFHLPLGDAISGDLGAIGLRDPPTDKNPYETSSKALRRTASYTPPKMLFR